MASTQTIPCSISIITSKADNLAPALEGLKEFAEIIICHGNAPEENLAVARAYGAKLVQQYDTDEPLVSSYMDKAQVRERAMAASTLPWRFFMDRDDRLTHEAIEEIRHITTKEHPTHLVWRMPTRIVIDGKEILHEASYPSYQTRLVHESVGAHFKGEVHERLVFDAKAFPIGTMRSTYLFHWSKERVAQYWDYLRTYGERELATTVPGSLSGFIRWGLYFRIRTILGYILWRLPKMYLQHGFINTMPLSIELTIVRYHLYLLFGSIGQFIASRLTSIIFIETLRGKDINRILSNIAVRQWEIYGRTLDIGGREGKSSYWRYMRHTKWLRKTTLDIDARSSPDVVLDIEREPIPFAASYFDTALFFNVLEHLGNGPKALSAIAEVMRPGGALIGIVPFLVGVHPDPHDFMRYTDEGLTKALQQAGFSQVEVRVVGRGPLLASYYQSEFLWPRLLKLLFIPIVLGLDALILLLRPGFGRKFPLSYAFRAIR